MYTIQKNREENFHLEHSGISEFQDRLTVFHMKAIEYCIQVDFKPKI